MPVVENGKTETEEEEMEQETPESEERSEDGDDLDSIGDDDEGISDLDEEECERRRNECLDDMMDLERQFVELKEHLHRERLNQIEMKLEEVKAGKAAEYLNPLADLQEHMKIRTQVAGIAREMRIKSVQLKCESEELASEQNMRSEKMILYDTLKQELEEKIRRLEEDRHNIDISSDLWNETHLLKKNKKKSDPFNPDRRRKPVTVSGPYIVYMLKDAEIIEDWTAIKKALKQQSQKRKSEL
ncbi:hypothetical protein CHS0354_040118 [Potamilus streckersoni]|uniref:Breast cancer metastasis-suppressor 1-like protein n=1 Tax=Potamilus streckersoni TaxID=2493646 RepID=A0AAE0ST18_9BIVA|nr:hypothetical protein CHS0354_040118 [Potamilus streckersoni]